MVYQVVLRHLETWLEQTRAQDPDGEPISAYIEQDFRQYLACGILAHGFARAPRAHCAGCGHDFLVAFSCKGRGVCPACTTRPSSGALDQQLLLHVLLRVRAVLIEVAQSLFELLPDLQCVYGIVKCGLLWHVIGDVMADLFDGLYDGVILRSLVNQQT